MESWTIKFSKRAEESLKKMDRNVRVRILNKIAELKTHLIRNFRVTPS